MAKKKIPVPSFETFLREIVGMSLAQYYTLDGKEKLRLNCLFLDTYGRPFDYVRDSGDD